MNRKVRKKFSLEDYSIAAKMSDVQIQIYNFTLDQKKDIEIAVNQVLSQIQRSYKLYALVEVQNQEAKIALRLLGRSPDLDQLPSSSFGQTLFFYGESDSREIDTLVKKMHDDLFRHITMVLAHS